MPLLKLTNQPYFPDPNSPASLVCAGEYCYPINQGDPIYQQWYQTPCGQNEITDPTFSAATYGADLVTNGDFALPFAPDWTAVDWTLVSGQAQGPVLDAVNSLTQSVAIVAYSLYRITFDLSGLSPGDAVRVYLGSLSGWAEFTQNGSYDQIIRAKFGTSDLVFVAEPQNLANALIDNVTLQLVTFTSWTTNGDWDIDIDSGIACADGSGTGLLEESVADYIVADDYYLLAFTVTGYVAGSVTPYVANVAGTAVTANGDYEMYITPTATGVVSFLPSADFVGCISAPSLRRLKNNYQIILVDSDGNRYDISENFEYYEDKVYIAQDIFGIRELDFGCYTIEITDTCLVEGIELVTNGDFALGYTDWTRNNGNGQYDLNAGALEFVFEPLENGDIITNGNFASGSAGWTFAGWTIGTAATHNTGNTSALSRSITIGTPAVAPNVRVTWIQLTVTGRTAGSFTVTLSDKTSASYSTNETFTFPLTPTIGGVVTFSITPTSTFDGVVDNIQVYQSLQPWSAYASIKNVANADMVAGNYSISYDQTANDNPGNIETSLAIVGQTQSIVYNDTVATHTNSITGYTPGAQQVNIIAKFREGNNYFPGRVTVDNVSAVRVEPFEATYVSECMNYQFEHPDTYLLTGTCDQPSFGFEFDNIGFKLQMRARVRGLNPIYNVSKNIAQFGTGNAAVKYADQTKYWQLATDFISESAHDALSTMVNCDHFSIGTSTANAIEYVAESEDYQPQWIQNGSYSLAPVTLNLRLKTGGQKFNRHT